RSGSHGGDPANRVAILVPAEDSGHISEYFPPVQAPSSEDSDSPLGTNVRSSLSARDDHSPPRTSPESSREVLDTSTERFTELDETN
uniref:Pleckstrin homology domain containing, family G (With RhoGef domain) member 4B n=1 Tax=Macrostomum lignano TaxID=282301 RepID=A0A1I8HT58_9PLAT